MRPKKPITAQRIRQIEELLMKRGVPFEEMEFRMIWGPDQDPFTDMGKLICRRKGEVEWREL